MADSPTIKEPTGNAPGGAQRWGGTDAVHAAQLLKGTHSSEKIQQSAIDGLLESISATKIVRVATTTNGTLATDFENADTIDGIALVTDDRILLKNQTVGKDNGIYIVQTSGAPVRASDFDADSEVVSQILISVEEGTVNGNKSFKLTTINPIIVGTTVLVFNSFATGEANTGSNIGVAGVGIFKQKTASDLEFKKINAGSSKISITDDTGNNEVDIDIVEANLSTVEKTANKNAINGYAGLNGSSKLTGSQQVYGTGVNTAAEGNDSRLSDARTPLAHTHTAVDITDKAAELLARSKHTGTQAASTISDFNTAVRTNRLDQMAAPTATVNVNDQVVDNVKRIQNNVETITSAAAITINFNNHELAKIISLANAPTFTTSNRAEGKKKRIIIKSDATPRALTFSEAWRWITAIPTTTAASKNSILTLECLGGAVTDVVAGWVEEP